MLKEVVDCNKQDARKLYTYVLEANEKKLCQTSHEVDRYTHAQLMLESMKEINSIRIQVRHLNFLVTFLKKTTFVATQEWNMCTSYQCDSVCRERLLL